MLDTTTKLSDGKDGETKHFTSDEERELNDLLNCYDEQPVLSWMRCVNWNHYINSMEKVHGKQN